MQQLVADCLGFEEIVARFGVTAATVRQRLKLANVAPRLFELYRADEINLDQLTALAVTDDHAAQERAWDSAQEWNRNPNVLRRALTQTKVGAASDPRVRFVGIIIPGRPATQPLDPRLVRRGRGFRNQ